MLADCRGFVGTIARIVLLDGSIRCNEAFPYGFASPISTSVYYPADIAASDAKLPVITFVGGILSNAGNYHELMKLWASHGFIVVISSDFINSFPLMHALGILEVAKLDRDPASALHGRADFPGRWSPGTPPAARPRCRAPASLHKPCNSSSHG